MTVLGINHIVLFVRDADRASEFYQESMGFRVVFGVPGKAHFLQAEGSTNDHDLAVMTVGDEAQASAAGTGAVGMYHVAWEVDTLSALRDRARKLAEMGALVGASDHGTTKSLYAKDPDGLEFEVAWIIPLGDLTDDDLDKRTRGPLPLDIDAEIARFGADRHGGIGVSRPLPVASGGA
jgi:catechol-2,3-dioxygenase